MNNLPPDFQGEDERDHEAIERRDDERANEDNGVEPETI